VGGDAKAEDSITVLQGIRDKIGSSAQIRFEKGCELVCDSDKDFAKAVDAVKNSDFTVLYVGETRDMSGEAGSRSNLDLPGLQLDLVKAVHATGKPYVVVLKNGRPLTIDWIAQNSPAILETWHAEQWLEPLLPTFYLATQIQAASFPLRFRETSDKFHFITITNRRAARLKPKIVILQNIWMLPIRRSFPLVLA
jgi:hypothetical protein